MSRVSIFPKARVTGAAFFAVVAAMGVAGCAGHGHNAVPSSAITLASGEGRDHISVVVPHGGTAYVLDKDADKVVWSGEVHTDDKLGIDGEGHRITLNDRTIAEDVHLDHRYRVSYETPYRP